MDQQVAAKTKGDTCAEYAVYHYIQTQICGFSVKVQYCVAYIVKTTQPPIR